MSQTVTVADTPMLMHMTMINLIHSLRLNPCGAGFGQSDCGCISSAFRMTPFSPKMGGCGFCIFAGLFWIGGRFAPHHISYMKTSRQNEDRPDDDEKVSEWEVRHSKTV